MKKILLLLSCMTLIFCCQGCAKTRDIKVASTITCQSSDTNKVGTVWTFKVNESGEILEAILETHVHKKYIKSLYPDADIDDIYTQFKNTFISEYNTIAPHQETKSWFIANIEGNDKAHTIDTMYTFQFTDELFNFELNREFLAIFGLDKFYHPDTEQLLYDKTVALTFFSKDSNAVCS